MTSEEKQALEWDLSAVKFALERISQSPNDADINYITAIKICYKVGKYYKHLIEPNFFSNTEESREIKND